MTLLISFLICVICVHPWQSLSKPIEKPRIVVYKRERKLELYADKKLIRTYRVGLGFSPVADKVREGDALRPKATSTSS